MINKIKDFIEHNGAEMTGYLAYDYGLGAEKTHSYFKIEITMGYDPLKKVGKKYLQNVAKADFVYDYALGSSTKELFTRLESFIFDLTH